MDQAFEVVGFLSWASQLTQRAEGLVPAAVSGTETPPPSIFFPWISCSWTAGGAGSQGWGSLAQWHSVGHAACP